MNIRDTTIVLDSNCLQTRQLEDYLRKSPSNKVVIITAATVEAYKNNYEKGLPRSFEILSKYTSQVLVAKNDQSVVSIHGRTSGLQRRFISKTDTENFSIFVEGVKLLPSVRALGLTDRIRYQKAKEVKEYLSRINADVEKFKEAISIRSCRYSKSDIETYRMGGTPSKEFIRQVSVEVIALVEHMAESLESKHNLPRAKGQVSNHFIFRLALANHLLVLDWIANGGAKDVKPDKLVNDVMDTHFITYATYFNGLMTQDTKPKRLLQSLRWWLENVFMCELMKPMKGM